MTQTTSFDVVLESVESLSIEEQEVLIDLVRRRLIEKRRSQIALNITLAQEEYQARQVSRGTVDELMVELDE